MADTTANATAGDGSVKVAVDDLGAGGVVQRVKPTIGVSGTANDVVAGSGVNGVGVQRVTLATDDAMPVAVGAQADAAAAADNSSASLIALTKRNNQNITTMSAKLPAALGTLADAASTSVAFTTEGKAQLGSLTETAPASDTASSGINGRLQRIAQRITSLIALFPAALGATTKATSLAVALPTDDPLTLLCAAPATGTQSIVASSATDVTILASNASRKGAYVFNDSTQILYLLCASATSSATVFTQKLAAGDSFSLAPGSYTGVLKGLWASANGNARVTEWT